MNLDKLTEASKLSPYRYISSMEQETKDDDILKYINNLCTDILMETFSPTPEHLDIAYEALEFCEDKLNQINQVKDSFKLRIQGGSFTRFGHSLDMLTCQDELSNFHSASIYTELSYNIEDLDSRLTMFSLILSKFVV